ncbi:MAG: DUF4197 domain-containing protein [Chitinophagaceae bacterium]|nr:DUF4197 domain-containing protein [Chitinophagaceae bacterium]
MNHEKNHLPVIYFIFLGINSCSTLKGLFTAQDATAAIKELLSFGTQHGGNLLGKNGAFSKEALMQSLLPKDVDKVINVLETLGLGKEVNRFTATLSAAAEKTAEKSVPIFLQGIKKMDIGDAVGIVKNGGTACTDYLRKTIGDTLRKAIAPEMNNALDEYKLAKQWNDLVAPAKLLLGDKLNLDLGNLMSGLVTNMMFNKIEEKEKEIRTKAQARNTALLQKVFGQVIK